jgi:hypothetical protein
MFGKHLSLAWRTSAIDVMSFLPIPIVDRYKSLQTRIDYDFSRVFQI